MFVEVLGIHIAKQFPNGQELQLTLTSFLSKQAAPFVTELWQMLVSAQSNAAVPTQLLEKKEKELLQARVLAF